MSDEKTNSGKSNFIKKWLIKKFNLTLKGDTCQGIAPNISDFSLNDRYVFDFRAGYWRGESIGINQTPMAAGNTSEYTGQKTIKKIFVKPVDVLKELEEKPRFFETDNLEEKIAMMNDRRELIKESYSRRELDGLVMCLENRKNMTEHFLVNLLLLL